MFLGGGEDEDVEEVVDFFEVLVFKVILEFEEFRSL